ncbi:hypothetical protein BaRGS_00015671 [Batillaria attramentaria]|uniref:Uncharacterized protein n=1 Tax=Batillaria attramentaria TaxID=370345 RepID=A0ABD0L200_9CAEN
MLVQIRSSVNGYGTDETEHAFCTIQTLKLAVSRDLFRAVQCKIADLRGRAGVKPFAPKRALVSTRQCRTFAPFSKTAYSANLTEIQSANTARYVRRRARHYFTVPDRRSWLDENGYKETDIVRYLATLEGSADGNPV